MPQKAKPKKSTTIKTPPKHNLRLKLLLPAAVTALAVMIFLLYAYVFVSTPNLPVPPLKELAAARGVKLGVLTYNNRLDDKPYTDILTSQYSFMTADGPIHWDTSRPSADTYDFKKMDEIVRLAKENGMSVQGHHLTWGEEDSIPQWVREGNYTPAQLRELMRRHITTVAGRYKGKVAEWTVVNEAHARAEHVYGTTDWWTERLGAGYIDDAFRWARQADPTAKLLLNDFYNETQNRVSDAQYDYLKDAKARGIPIDGIGMQLHVDAARAPDVAAMTRNMQRFAEIGVPVYITEFDVNTSAVKGGQNDKDQLEARITADVVRACIESQNCVSFNVFGITDKQSIVNRLMLAKSRSYLLTGRYEPRESFYAFREAWLRP